MKTYQNFINGEFVQSQSGETFESINPFNQQVVGIFARSQQADVDAAVQAARTAFDKSDWPKLSGKQRAVYLLKFADALKSRASELVDAEIADSGSTKTKAQTDLAVTIKEFKYCAKLAEQLEKETLLEELTRKGVSQNWLRHEPVGVCAQIIPWNFPMSMASWKLVPALAAGCTVVLKPAEDTPLTATLFAEIFHEIGLPKGVVNIITGYGKEAGEALALHPQVDKIAFTGSTEIGRHIMAEAAQQLKRVTLECGGKSANIVLEDADPEITLDGVLFSIYYHAGQCCTAGSRLLLPSSRYDEWVPLLVERAKSIALADPNKANAQMGPLISQKQQERVLGYIQSALDEGAELLLGGKVPSDVTLSQGFYVEPTILGNVTPNMRVAQEEIFGPVLCLMRYESVEEAVEIANNTIYGLASGVWTRDPQVGVGIANKLRVGTVWINDYHLISEKAPFGGFKQSGVGRELGPNALEEYLEVKHVHLSESMKREKKVWYDSILPPQGLLKMGLATLNKLKFVARNPEFLEVVLPFSFKSKN